MRIRTAREQDHEILLDIWHRSVRATHTFLSEEDIEFFYPLVRDHALKELELRVLESEEGDQIGFMGMTGNNIDALFLDPDHLRQGGGRLLVEAARAEKGPLTVDVNEQNPSACQFYESMGFVVERRSEKDGTGKPFPILHMRQVEA